MLLNADMDVLQVAKTLNERISKYGQVVLQTLAYAGTGDVLQIQSLLAICGEHIEVEENAGWKVGTLLHALSNPAPQADATSHHGTLMPGLLLHSGFCVSRSHSRLLMPAWIVAVQVAHQGPATLGIALVALSEELGTSMAHRALEHLLQYGEPSVRCTHTCPSLLAARN